MEAKIIMAGQNGSYERLDRIGKGTEGIAYLVKRLSDNLPLVAKVGID
jgi:serine/threonine protein kinase